MGIQGLLPFLKQIQREVHVSSFRGKKVAVDGYCWLHRGAYSCALQLVMKTEKLETLPFIKYCMKRVNMLLKYDITPVMVFDGGYLPLKAATEKERREKRQTNREKGKELLKEGRKSEAVDCFQKSVDVSPEMALALIKECRSVGVECIVAPYEADSQLAYLSKEGIVDLVITEDSDLLVFGCEKVLFKLDDSGNGKLIEINQLGKANPGLVGFTIDSFRHMCILSGCDYLASVPGIGLGKALKLMKRFNKDPYRVIKALHHENGKVPKDYEADFRKADQTFLYQMVFDPRSQQQVRLNELPSDVDTADFEFAGVLSSPRKAVGMARGNINPLNHAVMDSYSPSKAPPPKSKSRASSVMGGGAGWGKPVDPRPPTSLLTSDSSRKHFRPPKKLKSKPVATGDVDTVKDEDLQTMYLTASMAASVTQPSSSATEKSPKSQNTAVDDESMAEKKASKQLVLKSRFFSSASTSEETPSEVDVVEKLRTRRRLALMPQKMEGLASSETTLSQSVSTDTELESSARPDLEENKPIGRGRKRLSKEQSIRPQLQGFGYSKSTTKRARHSVDPYPLSLMDQDTSLRNGTTGTAQSPVKNPFAKSVMSGAPSVSLVSTQDSRVETAESLSSSGNQELREHYASQSVANPGSMAPEGIMNGDASVHMLPEASLTNVHVQPVTIAASTEPKRCSFMTSEDYITTLPSLSTSSHSVADSSAARQNGHLLGHSSLASKKRLLLGNSGKRRCGNRAMSKSSVNSKFKAPKKASESSTGLKQLDLLAQFGYSSHPQMSIKH